MASRCSAPRLRRPSRWRAYASLLAEDAAAATSGSSAPRAVLRNSPRSAIRPRRPMRSLTLAPAVTGVVNESDRLAIMRPVRVGIHDTGDGTTASVTAGSLRLNAAHCRRRQCRCPCPLSPTPPPALARAPLWLASVTTTAPRDPGLRPKPPDRSSRIRRSRPIPPTASVYRSCIGRTSDVYRPCIARIAAQCARDRQPRASPLEGIPKGPRHRLPTLRPARRARQALDPERVSEPYPGRSTPQFGKHKKTRLRSRAWRTHGARIARTMRARR